MNDLNFKKIEKLFDSEKMNDFLALCYPTRKFSDEEKEIVKDIALISYVYDRNLDRQRNSKIPYSEHKRKLIARVEESLNLASYSLKEFLNIRLKDPDVLRSNKKS